MRPYFEKMPSFGKPLTDKQRERSSPAGPMRAPGQGVSGPLHPAGRGS